MKKRNSHLVPYTFSLTHCDDGKCDNDIIDFLDSLKRGEKVAKFREAMREKMEREGG